MQEWRVLDVPLRQLKQGSVLIMRMESIGRARREANGRQRGHSQLPGVTRAFVTITTTIGGKPSRKNVSSQKQQQKQQQPGVTTGGKLSTKDIFPNLT